MIDVVVTGRSLPALQSALDLAEVGLSVMVLDDGSSSALRPWAERDPDGIIAEFAKRIAAPLDQDDSHDADAARLVEIPAQAPLLLQSEAWLPQSSPNVLGIPAVPLATETSAVLGAGGAFRAYLDRLTPLLTVGKTRMLGELVKKRMGAKTRDLLVDPQVFERFGVDASEVEVAVASPGLNEALSRAGSLSTAVLAYADRNVARETRVAPVFGAEAFVNTLLRRLELYGVRLRSERAIAVAQEDESWVVQLDGGDTLQARALIADLGASPVASHEFTPLVETVLPSEARVYAEIDMERPEWLAPGGRAIARVADWAVLLDASAEHDSADEGRPGSSEAGFVCRLVSKVAPVRDQLEGVVRLQKSEDSSSRHKGTGVGIEWLQGSTLIEVSPIAAPYRTLTQRHKAAEAIAALEVEHPKLLAVGRAIHGDDQAEALSNARAATVRLRRRLLGLSE